MSVLIIAEAGVNHNGQLDLAIRLCDAAKTAGADVIKFQTWNTDKLITKTLDMADYQKNNTGKNTSQYDMLKKLELSCDEFRRIKEYCDKIGILFASTADEVGSLDFLVKLGIPFIKIGSGDIGNVSFLRYAGSKNLPILLSTGMSTLSDVDISLNALFEGGAEKVTLLHCTTNYPCNFQEVNLNAMLTLRDAFHLPVGYSDHTVGSEVAVAAATLGANVVEKHFTLDKSMEGPDHVASMEPDELRRMVEQIRNVEVAMGDGIKRPTFSEKRIKTVITKRIVAARKINSGEVFSEENVCVKRSDRGELAQMWDSVIGRCARQGYEADEGIEILGRKTN